jgi:hypothetical protein
MFQTGVKRHTSESEIKHTLPNVFLAIWCIVLCLLISNHYTQNRGCHTHTHTHTHTQSHMNLTYMVYVFLYADYENKRIFTSPTVPKWQTRKYLCSIISELDWNRKIKVFADFSSSTSFSSSRHSQESLCL